MQVNVQFLGAIAGAGRAVTKDIEDIEIAYGNPAKVVRDNKNY